MTIPGVFGSDLGLGMVTYTAMPVWQPQDLLYLAVMWKSFTSVPSRAWLFLNLITPGHAERGSGKWLVKHLSKG